MFKSTIQEALLEGFNISMNKTAIEYKNKRITYQELDRKSDDIAYGLLKTGIEKGSLIGVLMTDKAEIITSAIGILKAGCVFVPMDLIYPINRLKSMVDTTEMNVIIIDENVNEDVRTKLKQNRKTLNLVPLSTFNNELDDSKSKLEELKINYSPDDMVYIYFTSGTSGKSKAIAGRNKGLIHFVEWEIETFNMDANIKVSQLTAQCHDPFLRDIFVPLCAGGTICIPESKEVILNPNKMIQWIETSEVNTIHCTPGMFRIFSGGDLTADNFKSLKNILLAGEKVLPKDLEKWYKTFGERIQLVNMYGPTETTLAKVYHLIQEEDLQRGNIPIGKPIKNTRLVILDKQMQVCNVGEVGEIYIRTPYRSLGYYRNDELTKEKFIPNPFNNKLDDLIYKTGDLGRLLSDGNVEFIGRVDRQVKIRGFRVELGEIEQELLKLKNIKECYVDYRGTSKDNDEKNISAHVLVAYIVLNDNNLENIIREHLELQLPEYMVPNYYIFLDEMPLTPNGKVDTKALPDPQKIETRKCIPPRNFVEEKLVDIWKDILEVELVSIDDNFLKIGGHSLNIMSLVSKVYKEFDVELPLGEIFQNPTLETLAEYIISKKNNDDELGNSIDQLFKKQKVVDNISQGAHGNFKREELTFKKNILLQEVKTIDNIEPFNDIYYKSCFYNGFFPVVNHFGGDLLRCLINDIIVYDDNENSRGINYISKISAEQLLEELGISVQYKRKSTDIIGDIIQDIAENTPVIIGVDCYYESIREDFYEKNNWAHNLLICGFNQQEETVKIIEHDNVNNLTYEKQDISYSDLYNAYNGYLQNFPNNNGLPSYLKFYPTNQEDIRKIDSNLATFRKNMNMSKEDIFDGIEKLPLIIDLIKTYIFTEEEFQENIDKIMGIFNNILNAKLAEKYRIERLIADDYLLELINTIIDHWRFARNVCEKIRFSKRFKPKSLHNAIAKLEEIYTIEKTFNQELYKTLNNQ